MYFSLTLQIKLQIHCIHYNYNVEQANTTIKQLLFAQDKSNKICDSK